MRLMLPLTIAVAVSVLAGCTDLSPLQNDIKDLRGQVSRLSSEQAAMKSSINDAAQSSRQARDASNAAASKADQALALAQSNQKAIEATNEKLDRMFHRKLSK